MYKATTAALEATDSILHRTKKVVHSQQKYQTPSKWTKYIVLQTCIKFSVCALEGKPR